MSIRKSEKENPIRIIPFHSLPIHHYSCLHNGVILLLFTNTYLTIQNRFDSLGVSTAVISIHENIKGKVDIPAAPTLYSSIAFHSPIISLLLLSFFYISVFFIIIPHKCCCNRIWPDSMASRQREWEQLMMKR